MEIKSFANLLAKDMLENKYSRSTSKDEVLFIPKAGGTDALEEASVSSEESNQIKIPALPSSTKKQVAPTSKQTTRSTSMEQKIDNKIVISKHSYVELNQEKDLNKGNSLRVKRKRCTICGNKTRWHCQKCKVNLCNNRTHKQNCVEQHAMQEASK